MKKENALFELAAKIVELTEHIKDADMKTFALRQAAIAYMLEIGLR